MLNESGQASGVSGPLLILSGPSGVGKTSVLKKLMETGGLPLRQSVSATTRPPRSGEINGKDYHFLSAEEFASELLADGFLEHAEVYGQLYGTLRREVESWRSKGFGVVLAIDVQGADQVRGKTKVDSSVFLTAPEEFLRQRLKSRGTDLPEVIERRLANARSEIQRSNDYNHVLINMELEKVVFELAGLWRPFFDRE